jgi:hypothetical protein
MRSRAQVCRRSRATRRPSLGFVIRRREDGKARRLVLAWRFGSNWPAVLQTFNESDNSQIGATLSATYVVESKSNLEMRRLMGWRA